MKIKYSVNNLRRLHEIPLIEMRPLTILLGRNSAGKSTFLRSMSLLRQSVETNASAPILWYGDYVDFGNYKSAVIDKDISKEITFSFAIENLTRPAISRGVYGLNIPNKGSPTIEYGNIKIDYTIGGDGSTTFRTSITISVQETDAIVRLSFSPTETFATELLLNDVPFRGVMDAAQIYIRDDDLFSHSTLFSVGKEGRLNAEKPSDVFRRLVERELSNIDARVGRRRISAEADRILSHRSLTPSALKSLAKADTQTFRHFYSQLSQSSRAGMLKRLNEICHVYHAINVLDAASGVLNAYFRAVEYIGPARARSERFYRQQELEVSEISPDGRNLPMFLASLDLYTLKEFSSWVERIFGYGVSVHKTEGHISINLEHGGKSVNVLDTGYGVSQVLPVLTQIWWMQQPDRYRRGSVKQSTMKVKTLLIEQPELHLHPAHQALLADVFVNALGDRSGRISFVVETHSESLINRLGELIASQQISSDDVQIAIFGDHEIDGSPQVTISTFDSEGVLNNWPYGFFNY